VNHAFNERSWPILYLFILLTWCNFHFRYDLMLACRDIGEGKLHIPELLGNVAIEQITADGAYETKLESARVQNEQLLGLLRRYTSRTAFSSR
jgi:hypothetical protein